MRKIIFAMVAMLAIGGNLFAVAQEGSGSVSGKDVAATGTGATLAVKLDLASSDNDWIEIGFSNSQVTSDTTKVETTNILKSVEMTGSAGVEKKTERDIYAYWIIRSTSDIDVKLGLSDGMVNTSDEKIVEWTAALSSHTGDGAQSATTSIANNNTGLLADHNGNSGDDYNSRGSVKIDFSTSNLAAVDTADTVYGIATVLVETGN